MPQPQPQPQPQPAAENTNKGRDRQIQAILAVQALLPELQKLLEKEKILLKKLRGF